MDFNHKAVVLGTNYYIGLAIVRNLGRRGIPVVTMDHSPSRYGISKYVKEPLLVPHFQEEEEAFVDYLVEYAKEQSHKPVLFLTADPYVTFLDRNFDILKKYYLFPTEQKGLLSKMMDKETLTTFTNELNIPTPEIIELTDENLIHRVDTEIGYPCIIKPRDSAPFVSKFRHKAFTIQSSKELEEKIKLLKGWEDRVFVQRIIPGPEENCYSYDSYYGPGSELKGFLTTTKIRQWPNNFGASTYAKQKWIPELVSLCDPLFKHVNFRGFAEVELKRDEFTGKVYLIEVNVRFINFTELLCQLGFETPYMYYCDSIGEPIPEKFINYNTNTYWKYKYEDLPAIRSYLKSGQMSFMKILSDYKFRHISSTWAMDDPAPGLHFFSWAIKRLFQKIFKRGE